MTLSGKQFQSFAQIAKNFILNSPSIHNCSYVSDLEIVLSVNIKVFFPHIYPHMYL